MQQQSGFEKACINKPMTTLVQNVKDDENFLVNSKWLQTKLPIGSVVTAYRLRAKAEHEKFDTQSCWIDVYFEHNKQEFKTRWSYKSNQFIKVKAK